MATHPRSVLSTDPQCLLLDEDGDLDISGGRTKFATGLTAAAQQADARIETIRGELFWARTVGFPLRANAFVSNLDAVLGDRFDAARAEAAFRGQLLLTPNAAAVTSFALNFDARRRKMRPRWKLRIAFDDVTATVAGGEA
ncbi:MAG: hypothetical protein ACRCU1_00430 [Alsobacter sp.]